MATENLTNQADPKRRSETFHKKSEQTQQQRMQDVQLMLENLAEREEATIQNILNCLYDVGVDHWIAQKISSRWLGRRLKSVAGFSKPAFRGVALYWFKRNCPELIADWLQLKVTMQDDSAQEGSESAVLSEADQDQTVSPVPNISSHDSTPTPSVPAMAQLTAQSFSQPSSEDISDDRMPVEALTIEVETAPSESISCSETIESCSETTEGKNLLDSSDIHQMLQEQNQEIRRLRTQIQWLTQCVFGVGTFAAGSLLLFMSYRPDSTTQQTAVQPAGTYEEVWLELMPYESKQSSPKLKKSGLEKENLDDSVFQSEPQTEPMAEAQTVSQVQADR